MFVLISCCTVVVVDMDLCNPGFQQRERAFKAGVRKMRVASIEADADSVEVANLQHFQQMLGRGNFVVQIFEQALHPKRMGKGFEMFNGGKRIL
jgi:hypothetical protein